MNGAVNPLLKHRILFFSILAYISFGYGCDSNKSSKPSPQPAANKTCSATGTGSKLSLQSSSTKKLLIGYDKASENGKDVTSTYSIKAIMTKHCISCHKSGGSAEDYSLLTSYTLVKKVAEEILDQVENEAMPLKNESAAKTILPYLKAWVDSGMPQAQPKTAATSSSTSTSTSTATKTTKPTSSDSTASSSENKGC